MQFRQSLIAYINYAVEICNKTSSIRTTFTLRYVRATIAAMEKQ